MCNKDIKKKHKVSRKEFEKIKEIVIAIKNDHEAMRQAEMLTASCWYSPHIKFNRDSLFIQSDTINGLGIIYFLW